MNPRPPLYPSDKDWYLTVSGTTGSWEKYKAENPNNVKTYWVEHYRNGGRGGLFSMYGAVTALREIAYFAASAAGLAIHDECEYDIYHEFKKPPKLKAVLVSPEMQDGALVIEAFSNSFFPRKQFGRNVKK